jgi:hypothetical protein
MVIKIKLLMYTLLTISICTLVCGCEEQNLQPDGRPVGNVTVIEKHTAYESTMFGSNTHQIVLYKVEDIQEPWCNYSVWSMAPGSVGSDDNDVNFYNKVEVNKSYTVTFNKDCTLSIRGGI